MTIPFERARAVLQTRKFLLELTDPSKTPKVPKRYRDMADSLLRHYPVLGDLKIVERGWGDWHLTECPFATKDDLLGELK